MSESTSSVRFSNKHPNLLKTSVSVIVAAIFVMGGFSVHGAHAQGIDPVVLGVTQITATQTFATADNTYADGWKWVFDVTVPTDQTLLQMKFADWTNGSNIIPAGGNIQFYSAQSTNASSEANAIPITASGVYSGLMYIDPSTDLDVNQGGRQIQITVEAKIPSGSAGGSYSTSYGINTTAPAGIAFVGLTQTYNSNPLPVTVTTDPIGLANTVTYTGINDTIYGPSTTAPIHVGTYSVNVVVTDPGYTGTSIATLTINPATISVVAYPQMKVYDNDPATDPTPLTYEAAPKPYGSDAFTGTLSRVPGENAGQYKINQGTLALDSDYTLTYSPNNFTITQAGPLTITGLNAQNKPYDGTLADTITGPPVFNGIIGTDDVTLVGTPVANFADKNVGNGKDVTVSGYTLGGTDAGNYTLTQPAGLTANITALPITVTAQPNTKIYDGNTSISTTTPTTTPALIAGDSPNFTEVYGGPNAGTGLTLIPSGSVSDDNDGKNYSITFVSDTTGVIDPASVTVSAIGHDRAYDGNTDATVSLAVSGAIGTDALIATPDTATFGTKDVGINKEITISGITLGGTDPGNYALVSDSATAFASITPYESLTIIGLTANDKVYDGTTLATITGDPSLSGVISGDNVTLEGTYTAAFDSQHVGTGKTVTITGYTLGGNDAEDYALTQPMLKADITALALTGKITSSDKTYDGSISATAECSNPLEGMITGDSIICNASNATFDSKDVGTGKTVTADLSLTGDNAGDYSVNSTATAFASITPASLTVSVTGNDKVYDGTTNAAVTLSDDRISGDALTDSYASANFLDPKVGDGKQVDVYGITISGTDAGDYNLINTQASTTADIAKASLEITANDLTKTYGDNVTLGTTITGFTTDPSPLFGGDSVTSVVLASDGAVSTALVSSSPYAITASDATGIGLTNYTITYGNGSLTVNPKTLTGTISATDKTYDGTTADPTICHLTGVINSDQVTCNSVGTFSDRNSNGGLGGLSGGKLVTANLSLSGKDAGNYVLGNTTATAKAQINQLPLIVTAVTDTKVYDGTTASVKTPTITSGSIATGDTAPTWTQTFDSADVGPRTLTPSHLVVSDGFSGLNYAYTYATAAGSITQASQTITFVTYPSGPITGNSFVVTATSTSGLTVTFTGGATNICSVGLTGTVNVIGSGQCPVTAMQTGNNDYSAAQSVTKTFTVTYNVSAALLASTEITSNSSSIGTLAGANLATTGSGSCKGSNGGTAGACYVLNVDTVQVSPTGSNLPAENDGFRLQATSNQQAALTTYFSGKGWSQSPMLDQINSEIAGTAPFFYFVSDGNGGYSLADGFQWALEQENKSLVIDDDYPAGTYTFTGYVNGNPVTVTLTVARTSQS